MWRNWRSDFGQREVRWQTCATSSSEYNAAAIAFNNWSYHFGHSTYHAYVGTNCNQANDENLRVWARTSLDMTDGAYCPARAEACFSPRSCYKADSPYTWGCYWASTLMNVIQGYIVFDWQWLNADPVMSPGGIPCTSCWFHFFAHEFGHAMALGHHFPNNCSEPHIMTGKGCIHMVNSGPAPNDVCEPDRNMGYGDSRC